MYFRTFDKDGYDHKGFDRNGRAKTGKYNKEGYDFDGYNCDGYKCVYKTPTHDILVERTGRTKQNLSKYIPTTVTTFTRKPTIFETDCMITCENDSTNSNKASVEVDKTYIFNDKVTMIDKENVPHGGKCNKITLDSKGFKEIGYIFLKEKDYFVPVCNLIFYNFP